MTFFTPTVLNFGDSQRSTNMTTPCPKCGSTITSRYPEPEESHLAFCEECQEEFSADSESEEGFNESMDGDAESALASAGFGTDEDYGCFNEPDMDCDYGDF